MVNLRTIRTRGWRALLALGLSLLAAAAFAQAPAPIPALDSPVVDTTGTLDATARAALEAQARALQQRKGSQLQVLMVASTQPEDIDSYAVRAFEQFKLGRKGVDDGVLLVVAKDDRRVRIEVGYGLEGAITDLQSGRIIQEYLAPKFRTGDYAGGLLDATAMLTRLIDGEPLPEPMGAGAQGGGGGAGGGNWVMALVLAMIGSALIRGVFGGVPALLRGAIGGVGAGAVAWLLAMSWGLVALAAACGFFFSLFGRGGGHYAGSGGWGGYGGGWGGGGGSGGGGWSGGGGSSGGGGASGSW